MADEPAGSPGHDRNGGGWRPIPDPTILTTEQLLREIAALTSYVDSQFEVRDERLRGIDEATRLRMKQITKIPEEVVAHERELIDRRFDSVDLQFRERDTRTDKIEALNKVALDAAFAAQKEAAAKQDEANQKAIDKSEKATKETIDKNEQLTQTNFSAVNDKIDDIKLRMGAFDATLVGLIQAAAGNTKGKDESRATIAFGVTLLLALVTIVGFAIAFVVTK